jgi:predicted ATPase
MVQWLRGLPDQADHSARTLLADIEAEGHPVSSYLALTWSGCLVSLWIGNLDAAERSIAQLKDQAENHSLVSYYSCALGFEGQLSLARGDPVAAERLIRDSLAGLRQAHFEVPYTPLLSSLAEALVSAGSLADGLAAADEALQRAERSNAFWWMPEALRIKGEALLVAKDDVNAAAEHFRRSLDLAHRQGALSWELRAATSLARLRRDQGRIAEARDLLASVYRRFTEGFGTADLRAAKALVEELEGRVSGPSNAAPDVYRQGKCRVIAGQ